MGFNSVLFICNDCMGSIDDHPDDWWRHAKRALGLTMNGKPVTFSFRGNANHCQAVWNGHSDNTVLIAAGGNHSTILGTLHQRWVDHSTPEGKVELLKQVADDLGYSLVKKRKRRTTWQDIPSPGQSPESSQPQSVSTSTPRQTKMKPSDKPKTPTTKRKTSSTSKSSVSKKKVNDKKATT